MDRESFLQLVTMAIVAYSYEKVGLHESSKQIWEEIAGAGDTVISVMETMPGSLFEKEA